MNGKARREEGPPPGEAAPEPPPFRATDFTAAGEPPPARAVRPRDAATLLLWRQGPAGLEVLMGVRSSRHRFMPGRLVFPGGRVDAADSRVPLASPLRPEPRRALEHRATPARARAIATAAVRELWEETGLRLGDAGPGGALRPDLAALDYLCRAVTPPMSPVRFNARFLTAPADAAQGGLAGSGELEALGWYPVSGTPERDLAPITAQVLAEFRALMALPEVARPGRPLIWFQGRDRRRLEGPARARPSAAAILPGGESG
ncbi:NUDIX domain-containing protein [Roseomonas sp. OT10]|uniref:NUDIX hydrolase n=1 Tax=Roseomonas cutis TaxID=2897332 RepID=UPI001E3DA959|nr:NUDIX domain-containing protein [Roseomonas sp. OT10]UFN49582.1 NUDIX domain-containing protein [Roseomonas sp. OT10]